MATIRPRGKTWEVIIKRKGKLPKPVSFTFDTREEGAKFAAQVELLLDKGIVPPELLPGGGDFTLLGEVITLYYQSVAVPDADKKTLDITYKAHQFTRLSAIDYKWVEAWITTLKRDRHLSPSTIRHYVGSLGRCLDWLVRRGTAQLAINPIRALPRRYAMYNEEDIRLLAAQGHQPKFDVERERRLHPDEETRIREELKSDDLKYKAALEFLFTLALESGMRMREMFTISTNQVDVANKTVFLDKTKNGHKRQVPLTTIAIAGYKAYLKHIREGTGGMKGFNGAGGRIFPWWSGKPDDLKNTTSKISMQFARIFDRANCGDMVFHDLRHEATSRFFEKTALSDTEIAKITGHKDIRMLSRYANLRGSKLADKLW